MHRIDFCYIVTHGFAARMIMQTNLLGKLVESGKNVGLITLDANDNNIKNYCLKNNVVLYEYNPKLSFLLNNYVESRKYLLEDIINNTALYEKHLRATRFNKAKNPWRHIRPRILYLLYLIVKKFPELRKRIKRLENYFLYSENAKKLIELINAKVVVSTYPVDFKEAILINAANKLRIKTVIHLLSWDNITCKGIFPKLSDEYIVWGNIMKDELIQYYNVNKKNIHVCGVPHFDLHLKTLQNPNYKKYLTDLGLKPDHPYIFFGMSSPRFAPKEIDIVESLSSFIENNTFGSKMQLIIRPHPQNIYGGMENKTWIERLKKLNDYSRVAVDFPDLVKSNLPWSMQHDDMVKLSNLLVGAKVILNSGSTLSIDSLMCDVPVILTSFDGSNKLDYWESARRLIDYPHLKKLVKMGGVEIAQDYNTMIQKINTFLDTPSYKKENRDYALKNEVEISNVNATDRVVSTLLKIHERG